MTTAEKLIEELGLGPKESCSRYYARLNLTLAAAKAEGEENKRVEVLQKVVKLDTSDCSGLDIKNSIIDMLMPPVPPVDDESVESFYAGLEKHLEAGKELMIIMNSGAWRTKYEAKERK